MKILITSDWYTPAVNGVVASILALRRQLEARGHEVRVLTLSSTVHTTCENGVYAVGSVDAGLIYPGARLRSFAVGQTVRRLVEWKPDVVHSQCEFSTFFLARHIARAVGAPPRWIWPSTVTRGSMPISSWMRSAMSMALPAPSATTIM